MSAATDPTNPDANGRDGAPPSLPSHVLLAALWQACRPWALRSTGLVIIAVGGLAMMIKYWAESNLLSVFLAYLPVWVLALPFSVTLAAGALFLCWRSVVLSMLCPALVVLWLGGYSVARPAASWNGRHEKDLVVMSYNRGQGSEKVLTAFTSQVMPDIAVFQDAARRLPQIAALPQFAAHRFHLQEGEFVLLSRWPLVHSEVLMPEWTAAASGLCRVGTRSIVDWDGQRVVVYNIHLPTPRDLLSWYARRGTFLYGLLGLVPGTGLFERHQQYLATWKARVGLVSHLASRVRSEVDPVILLGDLNLPPVGEGYRQLCGVLHDTHTAGGQGFGHTFPSNMKSMRGFLGPWIRIDYIFASAKWDILYCAVAPREFSQHLPVAAVLRRK